MPPRYAFWTILIDGKPTAFRAREKEELLPTFQQLRRTNKDVVFKWFARGRLWATPEEARAEQRAPKKATGEKRGGEWRPGGAHADPRARFKKNEKREGRLWTSKPPSGRPPGVNRPWSSKPPTGHPPRGDRPRSTAPPGGKPARGDRLWTSKPPPRQPPRGPQQWGSKPPSGRPPHVNRQGGRPSVNAPRGDRSSGRASAARAPHGDRSGRNERRDKTTRPFSPPEERRDRPPDNPESDTPSKPKPEAVPDPPAQEQIVIKPEPPERG
jgi:hypothetical protein